MTRLLCVPISVIVALRVPQSILVTAILSTPGMFIATATVNNIPSIRHQLAGTLALHSSPIWGLPETNPDAYCLFPISSTPITLYVQDHD